MPMTSMAAPADGTGDVPAPPDDQGPQQDVGDIGLAGQDLADLGRRQGQHPAIGRGPCSKERTLAGHHVQLAGELARPMAGKLHAGGQRVVAHDDFAAQHHEQVTAFVLGRVQDFVGRDPTRRAISAQAGLLTVVKHGVSDGFAGRTWQRCHRVRRTPVCRSSRVHLLLRKGDRATSTMAHAAPHFVPAGGQCGYRSAGGRPASQPREDLAGRAQVPPARRRIP